MWTCKRDSAKLNLKIYRMDKFNHRLTVIIMALAFIIQVICLLYDWTYLSTNGAGGRSLLIILNGIALAIIGTLNKNY